MKHFFFSAFSLFIFALCVNAAVYEVKPNTAMDTIAEVPWATLQPGDTVLIYWKPTPYKEKWVICRQGTANAPITVRGVLGPNGERPVIDGNGAVTPTNLNFWNEARGVIKIGGANVPADTMPRHIVIENLEVRGAYQDYQFTNAAGQTATYAGQAAPIYVEKVENLIVRNCIITDGGNGLFIGSSDQNTSRDILIEGNYIYGNGIIGNGFVHNNYTAALNITFQYNRFGPLRQNLQGTRAPGSNLKDRSAGLVVRYNWIEGGNRQLDLVEGEDSAQIRNAPEYRKTFVYGNILIESESTGNNQITHYGGDIAGNEAIYRHGTLYFYNNTVVSMRTGTTAFFRLSTNQETCDARNNIFFATAAGTNGALLAEHGNLILTNNWIKTGWRNSFESGFDGTVTGGATFVQGSAPGFVDFAAQNFRLLANSPAVNAGTILHPDVLPVHNAVRQYVKHQTSEARPINGVLDLGAYEFSNAPVQITTASLPNARRGKFYNQTLQATGGSGGFVWTVSAGTLPHGMWLDSASGKISGKAARRGTWNFTITAQDSQNTVSTAAQNFTIDVRLYQ
jgi:hypothetical protein